MPPSTRSKQSAQQAAAQQAAAQQQPNKNKKAQRKEAQPPAGGAPANGEQAAGKDDGDYDAGVRDGIQVNLSELVSAQLAPHITNINGTVAEIKQRAERREAQAAPTRVTYATVASPAGAPAGAGPSAGGPVPAIMTSVTPEVRAFMYRMKLDQVDATSFDKASKGWRMVGEGLKVLCEWGLAMLDAGDSGRAREATVMAQQRSELMVAASDVLGHDLAQMQACIDALLQPSLAPGFDARKAVTDWGREQRTEARSGRGRFSGRGSNSRDAKRDRTPERERERDRNREGERYKKRNNW